MMAYAVVLVAGLLLIVNPVTVRGDCQNVLNGLAGDAVCAALQQTTQEVAPSAADADCLTVLELEKRFPVIPAQCCPALRELVTAGCACDEDFQAVIAGLGGYELSAVGPVAKGTAKLIQEGTCATPAYGGRVVNPCDGTNGVCPASARRLLF